MAENRPFAASPDELRTLKLAGMMYAREQDEADAAALADEAVPQPPADIQAKTDEAVFAVLRAHAAKSKRRRRAAHLLRAAAVVALIACVSVPLAFTVDASRAAVANFLIQNFGQFSRITYDVENNARAPVGWMSEYYPQWLPEGYEFDQIVYNDKKSSIWYTSQSSYWIYFSMLSQGTLPEVDTENTVSFDCEIGAYSAELHLKKDKTSSLIVIFAPESVITIQGSLTKNEILKIANNIHGL